MVLIPCSNSWRRLVCCCDLSNHGRPSFPAGKFANKLYLPNSCAEELVKPQGFCVRCCQRYSKPSCGHNRLPRRAWGLKDCSDLAAHLGGVHQISQAGPSLRVLCISPVDEGATSTCGAISCHTCHLLRTVIKNHLEEAFWPFTAPKVGKHKRTGNL